VELLALSSTLPPTSHKTPNRGEGPVRDGRQDGRVQLSPSWHQCLWRRGSRGLLAHWHRSPWCHRHARHLLARTCRSGRGAAARAQLHEARGMRHGTRIMGPEGIRSALRAQERSEAQHEHSAGPPAVSSCGPSARVSESSSICPMNLQFKSGTNAYTDPEMCPDAMAVCLGAFGADVTASGAVGGRRPLLAQQGIT
jgi:hypothetical protein